MMTNRAMEVRERVQRKWFRSNLLWTGTIFSRRRLFIERGAAFRETGTGQIRLKGAGAMKGRTSGPFQPSPAGDTTPLYWTDKTPFATPYFLLRISYCTFYIDPWTREGEKKHKQRHLGIHSNHEYSPLVIICLGIVTALHCRLLPCHFGHNLQQGCLHLPRSFDSRCHVGLQTVARIQQPGRSRLRAGINVGLCDPERVHQKDSLQQQVQATATGQQGRNQTG